MPHHVVSHDVSLEIGWLICRKGVCHGKWLLIEFE